MFVVEQVCLSPREGTLYGGFRTKEAAAAAAAMLSCLEEPRSFRRTPTIREVADDTTPLYDPTRPDGWFFEYGLEG